MEHYSLSSFNQMVKQTLKQSLAPSYWIIAEIGEMNIAQKGHCYMELVEKENNFVKAKMRATIWSYTFGALFNQFERMTGTTLKAGMQILLNASFEFHEIYGISLNIKDIDPQFTLGERERKKRETLLKLEEEGIIDLNRSLILPQVPQRIAIISSETAAGYGDFMNQFDSNPYGYRAKMRLFNSVMQGDQAITSIIDSLHRIYEIEDEIDLIILIRGGGAQMDLDCFDDFELCSHLAQFPLPVITGIGHERDKTIADRVANVSLKTPTAVAEFLVSGMMDFENEILESFEGIRQSAKGILQQESERLSQSQYLIRLKANQLIQQASYRLETLTDYLERRPVQIINEQRKELASIERLMKAQDPKEVLKKGYSITRLNGKVLKAGQKLKVGDDIETQHQNEVITSTVKQISKN
ncbi:exodeoxyribonuclease VII large subunit [Reichenbachiella ulvae]|uniref:Exodeoxyribonuclease 7 large subunit n=1 Tax=Reichenbachiella ulvae TaxID=2980104 RepID=A0ABT3CPT1_9BACT|nr:exodeoxyribonuclease VII large subunit [Reichenbachiella ulvae]MCV9385553.1 exodeoxyribonuclease VII large subunit [Reichenbachiella ulvae]